MTREEIVRQDIRDLERLGYAQQLFREMGGFSNFAISFSIISVLTGAVLLFGYGLKFAGPIVNSVGWPLVSVLTLCVAASMAELASAYPTAGGLYFWAFRLGGRTWAWVTAWLNMIGQVTITAGINVAAAIYLIGAVTRIFGLSAEATVPVFGSLTNWYFQVFVMALLMVPQVLINVRGIRLTARLNDLSVWWHVGGVLLIAVLLAAFGRHHNPIGFLFQAGTVVGPLEAASADVGGRAAPALVIGELKLPSPLFALVPALSELYAAAPFALAFVLALLQAQWTYTGYDASAHVAEETTMARLNCAWGIFLSVAVSAIVGYVMLLIFTWCIPGGDVAKTANDAYPVLYVVYGNLATVWAHVIAIVIGGAMWLCGLASITSMGRMWYAFARDDGMPGAHVLKRIHATTGTPVVATLVTSALAVLICLYAAAYSVVTSISTIALYLAYGIPIWLNFRNRRRNRRRRRGEFVTGEQAPWNLGRWAPLINAVAIVWIVVLSVVFVLPPNELVLWTMILMAAALAAYWRFGARRRFRGPMRA
jgi:amino acid transporter